MTQESDCDPLIC